MSSLTITEVKPVIHCFILSQSIIRHHEFLLFDITKRTVLTVEDPNKLLKRLFIWQIVHKRSVFLLNVYIILEISLKNNCVQM